MSGNTGESLGGLRIGDAIPERRYKVTQEQINRYAEASGDRNPLHTDPEFAKQTIFRRTIAHGLLTLSFLSQAMAAWDWKGWAAGGGLDITFLGPVYPDDEVTVRGTVTAFEVGDEGVYAVCDVACVVNDRTVIAGTARRRLEEA
ncbi:MAG: MaoC family dehydratase [Alphaproteobacteria bacterium]|nr:MaoC family dehydratase [Alphaproteobacteria bacterium]